MDLSTLIYYGKNIFFSAIILLIIFSAAFTAGYVLYKKVRPNAKPLNKRFFLLLLITMGYLFCLFGSVLLTRYAHYEAFGPLSIQLHPFRAYREAWYQFSTVEWRNIIINILLFIPLGFLLSLYTKKLQHIIPVFFLSFLFTLAIELTQLLTHRGIFEVDDLINNTLGAIIGYGIISFLLSLKKKRRGIIKFLYLTPLFATICLFVSIFAIYEGQELGNLSFTHLVTTNMDKIDLSADLSFSDLGDTAPVYQTQYASLEEATAFASSLYTHKNLTIDHSRTTVYENTVVFYNDDGSYHLWVDYAGLTYEYTDFSLFNDGMSKEDSDELSLRSKLISDFNLEIPQNAFFSAQDDGIYRFDLSNDLQEDILWNGSVELSYYNDGTIKSLRNKLIPYYPYKDYSIISVKEAYHKIEQGKFRNYGPLTSLKVTDVTLSYTMDTKGFYQPVYLFQVEKDGVEDQIMIAAID